MLLTENNQFINKTTTPTWNAGTEIKPNFTFALGIGEDLLDKRIGSFIVQKIHR